MAAFMSTPSRPPISCWSLVPEWPISTWTQYLFPGRFLRWFRLAAVNQVQRHCDTPSTCSVHILVEVKAWAILLILLPWWELPLGLAPIMEWHFWKLRSFTWSHSMFCSIPVALDLRSRWFIFHFKPAWDTVLLTCSQFLKQTSNGYDIIVVSYDKCLNLKTNIYSVNAPSLGT